MTSFKYYYDPNTIELLIVRVESKNDSMHYEIKCKTLRKQYIWFGDLVESLSSLYVGYDYKYLIEVAKFKTQSEAEAVARSLKFDNVTVVKTITTTANDNTSI